jgi:phosphomannomutase
MNRPFQSSVQYITWLQEIWHDTPPFWGQIVLDPQFGSFAGVARTTLQAVFPQLLFTAIRDALDPVLAVQCEQTPKEESHLPLIKEVLQSGALAGFLLEQDQERLSMVDSHGLPFEPVELDERILRAFGGALENETVLCTEECSSLSLDFLQSRRAKPVILSGATCPDMTQKMEEKKAILGFDSQGRYFFRAIGGMVDPLFTICFLLDDWARRVWREVAQRSGKGPKT